MKKANYRVCVTLLGTAALSGLLIVTATAAYAEVAKLRADLKGSHEVPPTKSSGSGRAEASTIRLRKP